MRLLLRGIAKLLLYFLAEISQYLTRAATVIAATSGEALVPSGRAAYRILRQSSFAEVSMVWGVPRTVVGLISACLSLVVSAVSVLISMGVGAAMLKGSGEDGGIVAFSAVISCGLCIVITNAVLHIQVSVLLDAVEALFLLYRISEASGAALETKPYDDVSQPLLGLHHSSHLKGLKEVMLRLPAPPAGET